MTERRFQRVPFQAETSIATDDSAWQCTLLNIALKGALVESDRLLIEPGTICQVSVRLPETDILLNFRARLLHRQANRFGFKFIDIDLQTLTHLRKLIELNTGDGDGIRDELMAWLEDV
ncbi:MAG TPA: PilZ domain-containing protein [Desulfuromonadales bacterium]|nr:PilZ domain-containing protein [Desulfuromonadales bacterium]